MNDLRDAIPPEWRLWAPLHPEAWRVVPVFALATLILFWIWTPLGWIGLLAMLWCATLFRETPRTLGSVPPLVASPIDGIIGELGSAAPPPVLGIEGDRTCLCVVSGPWDSHVLRVPMSGRVSRVMQLHTGAGERLALRIDGPAGEMAMVLVAEGWGRRARSELFEGQSVEAGSRLGMILFTGHAELYLPAGAVPPVSVGQRLVGGETALSGLTAAEPPAPRKPRTRKPKAAMDDPAEPETPASEPPAA